MSELLLKSGRLICPASGLDKTGDLMLKGGKIAKLGGKISAPQAKIIDCAGLVVAPGLIDMHVHLREPGHEYKEDVISGAAAAASGGFTAVACMPNTDPVNDTRSVTELIMDQAARAKARVYPVGSITKGLGGSELSEMAELKGAGCVAVSDDGRPVADSRVLRRGMEYADTFDLPVICHSEDLALAGGGVMHEGPTATRLGLKGIPAQSEVIAVERDLNLALLTGARVHIAHVSCAGSVQAVRRAKQKGARVSCETAPHYLYLCDQDVGEYDTNFKMNPPLRSKADRRAVRKGLADGVIDMVATDHAPHSALEKLVEFDLAAFGVIGLESSLPLMLGLVDQGLLTLPQLIERMSTAPARTFGLPGGKLEPGQAADITVIDLERSWAIDPERFASKSRNCPFAGMAVKGRAAYTICKGKITHKSLESGK